MKCNIGILLVCLLTLILVTGLTGCKNVKIEYSAQMEEKGVVNDVIFTPSSHTTTLTPGMDFDGNSTLHITSSSVPEKFSVIFFCEHKVKFVIQGSDEFHRELWKKLRRDQAVTIVYREVYRVTYEHGEMLTRELVDYDFLDAN